MNYSSSDEEEDSPNSADEAQERCSPKAEENVEIQCHQSTIIGNWEPPTLQLGSNSGARDSIMAAAAEGRRHESRVRTFPHVEGMYPTLVMVPVVLGPPELETLARCIYHLQQLLPGQLHPLIPQLHHSQPECQQQQQPPKQATHASLKRAQPHLEVQSGDLHISLSHCVPVRFADLELLIGHLRESLQSCQRPDRVTLEGLSTFCNTECTRTFLSIPVVQGAKQVVAMTKAVDRSFSVLGLRTFHKDPRPHMSIAWMLGDQRSHLVQVIEQLQHQQFQQPRHQPQQQQPQHQQRVLWPPIEEPDGQLQVRQQQQPGSFLPSSCQWQGQTEPGHSPQDAGHTGGEQSSHGQQRVSESCQGGEQSTGYLQEVPKGGRGQERRREDPGEPELTAQGLARQTNLGNGDGSVHGSACLPRHSFSLQAVLCRTAQKEHVVWGELGQASKVGVSQKRRK